MKNKSEALGRLDWQICGAFDFMFPRVSFEAGTTYSIIPIENRYRTSAIRIAAQDYLLKFYSDFGFQSADKKYLEDYLPHTEMFRS